MATTLIYSDSVEFLRKRVAETKPGEVTLVRDASHWYGEVEKADAVEVYGEYPELAKAYGVEASASPKPAAQPAAEAPASPAKQVDPVKAKP